MGLFESECCVVLYGNVKVLKYNRFLGSFMYKGWFKMVSFWLNLSWVVFIIW